VLAHWLRLVVGAAALTLFRYLMLPVSLASLTFFGFDRVMIELHKRDLQTALVQAAQADTPQTRFAPPEQRLRQALRSEAERARKRNEANDWNLREKADGLEVSVAATYRTRFARYMGEPEWPAPFRMSFGIRK
jgi:hypothetical protein